MKKPTSFLLKQYAKMSRDKKVRLGMEWSQLVREGHKAGKIQTQTNAKHESKTTSLINNCFLKKTSDNKTP